MKTLATIFYDGASHEIAIYSTLKGFGVKITTKRADGDRTNSMSSDFIGEKTELELMALNICQNYVKTAWLIGMDA